MTEGSLISPEERKSSTLTQSDPKPLLPTKKGIRSFTKSTPQGREARHNIAVEIVLARKGHADYQQEMDALNKKLKNEARAAEYKREFAEFDSKEIDRLRGQIGLAEASLVSRMYGLVRRESPRVKNLNVLLEQREASLTTEQLAIETNIQAEQQLRENIERFEQEKSRLKQARNILDEFYRAQGKKMKEFQEQFQREQERRSQIERRSNLEDIIREYQVLFLHGISQEIHPIVRAHNNQLRAGADNWQTRLAILLTLKPDICAHTIKEGDSSLHMFSKMGVILNKGTILLSAPEDVGTYAVDLDRREGAYDVKADKPIPFHMQMEPEAVSESIKTAIKERAADAYNEFIIDQPEIVGFYICPEPEIVERPYVTPSAPAPITEIIKSISTFGIPLYVIENGKIYEAEYKIDPYGKVEVRQAHTPITPVNLLDKKAEKAVSAI